MKQFIRFPNESCFQEADIDMHMFKPNTEFDDEVFGWYEDLYISIRK